MRPASRETLGYSVLLVVLFAIATLAVWQTISFLYEHVSGYSFTVAASLVWSLTLGFMLIAGAFGIWAIQFAAQAEGRRRVGRFVDAMDYLRDGLLAVDRRGRIAGANPAARALAGTEAVKGKTLREVFECLSDEDASLLLAQAEPQEVERRITAADDVKILRFRSQPSEGLSLVLLSDVTAMNAQRLHTRQVARLQLIGQIARGVAHDFNNLLCAISGHASLLSRLPAGSPELAASVHAISQSVERGSSLASHLLQLSRAEGSGETNRPFKDSVQAAAVGLKNTLSEDWRIDWQAGDTPPAALSGLQVEQIVMNLGLLIADASSHPGTLRLRAGRPSDAPVLNVGSRYAAAITIGMEPLESDEAWLVTHLRDVQGDSGVIVSVVRSVIEGAGGVLQRASTAQGLPVYRVGLPAISAASRQAGASVIAELGPYVADWNVLMARHSSKQDTLADLLRKLSVNIQTADSIVSLLAHLQENRSPDAVILDQQLLGAEPRAVVRAVLRLSPASAFVVVGRDEGSLKDLSADMVFVRTDAPVERILIGMVEAKSLASRRQTS